MNKKLTVFIGIFLALTVLPMVVLASSNLLVQNNVSLDSNGNQTISIEDIEFKLLDDLLLEAMLMRVKANDINKDLNVTLRNLYRENPLIALETIKLRITFIKEALTDDLGLKSNILRTHQKILDADNKIRLLSGQSRLLTKEKSSLYKAVMQEFVEMASTYLLDYQSLLNQILQKLEEANNINPNPAYSPFIEDVKLALKGLDHIINITYAVQDDLANTYLKTINSNPERIVSALEGDLTGDGKVDIFDLVTVAKNFGKKIQ